MNRTDAATQRRIFLQVLIDLELPSHTRITIDEPQSSLCVLVCTFTRSRHAPGTGVLPVDLHEQVRIADWWAPQQIRDNTHEAVETLRKRSGRA